MDVHEAIAAIDQAFAEIATGLMHQADELEAIAEQKKHIDPLTSQFAAGAAAGLRAVIRGLDREKP